MGATRHPLSLLLATALGLAASPAAASPPADGPSGPDFLFGVPDGSIGFRGGLGLTRAGGDLFSDVTEWLTLDRGDFRSTQVGVDVALRLHDRVDLVADLGYGYAAQESHFREWTDQDEVEIEQETRLHQVPLTLSGKLYLTDRGRRISDLAWIPARFAPYVGAGGGVMWYRFEQEGDFVDFTDLAIFSDRMSSDGWTPTAHLFGGLDVGLGAGTVAFAEARVVAASADPGGDFDSYDELDLSRFHTTVGLRVRF